MTRGSVFLRRRVGSAVSLTLATALAGAVVLLPSATGSVASAAVTQSPGLSAGHVLSGLITHDGEAGAQAFANFRHSPVTAVVDYVAQDSWNEFTNVANEQLTNHFGSLAAHHVWSVPLIPNDGWSTLEAAASGSYDSKYYALAQGLVAGGDAASTIRLGWEQTGSWFAWSGVKDPAAYIGAFQHAVTAMRSVPGQHFTFDYSIAMGAADPVSMYPGDAYVDIVGVDNYDNTWSSTYSASNHPAVWNQILTETGGLNWLAAFAAAHGKRMSIPEWGLAYRCDGRGGGDDPYFIDEMRSWIDSHDVAYEAYFDTDDNSCTRFTLTSGLFPNAAAEYVKDWSGASNTVTNPVTPATAPVVAPPAPAPAAVQGGGLMLSYSSNRAAPVSLQGASVGKSAYIFYSAQAPVRLVVFSLDGKPYRSESVAAYDLMGTTASGAKPFPTDKLKAGQHTVSALITLTTGVQTTVSATFTVPAPIVKPLTTRLLRVSSVAYGHTVRLNLAVLRGTKYLIFPKVVDQASATYRLDGRVIRFALANKRGHLKVASLKLTGLRRGLHHLTLRLVNKAGVVVIVRARFRVV